MNAAEHARWLAYLRSLMDQVGLKDWRLSIDDEPCADDCAASIAMLPERKHATIRLAKEWAAFTPDRQRQTAVHELLHCHLRGTQDAVDTTIGVLGSAIYGVVSRCHEQALEYGIDGIAEAIAPLLPLPEDA